MQIKNKLSLYFTVVSAVLSLVVLLAINILFSRHTNDDFFIALKERAIVTAQVYLEADEISDSSLQHFKTEYLNTLPSEVIGMYNSEDNPVFIAANNSWPKHLINRIRRRKYLQFKDKSNEAVGIRYDDNQGSFVIIASAFDKVGREHKLNLLKISVVLYLLQLLVIFLVSQWFAGKMLHPVQRINNKVKMINVTDLHLRVDEGNGRDEISTLAANFNSLLQRLETSFEMQKTFVANASHELRTPLTTIIGEIEVATAQPRERQEYENILTSILAEAEKLSGVIEGLMSLGSAENMIALQSVEEVRIDDILWELQEACKKNKPENILIIHMPSMPQDETKLCITANKHLVSIAISNVVRNAFKFSYNQPVDCTLNITAEGIQVTIKDKGIGISADVLKNLYQPFYRSKQVAAFEGQGLGLFITKKIIDLYKGTITVSSQPSSGTTVNILFAKNNWS